LCAFPNCLEKLKKCGIDKGSLSRESSLEGRTWDSDGAHMVLGSGGNSEKIAFHSRGWERLG